MKTLPLGAIATNLTPRQLFGVCLALLSDIAPKVAEKQKIKPITKAIESLEPLSLIKQYQLDRAISSIIADLNKHVPIFSYLGYRANEKTQLGVWIDLDELHRAENAGQLTQVSGNNWRNIKSNYILDMSGATVTLYRRRGKKTIWSTE